MASGTAKKKTKKKANPRQRQSQQVVIGDDGFIARHGVWSAEQKKLARQLPTLIADKGIKTIRVVYSDQHGLMRGKSLDVTNFLLSLQNGVAETVANLGKDTSNTPIIALFARDGGFGVELMGGGGDIVLVPDPRMFRILPWAADTAWIISDLYLKDGARCPFDCRYLMQKALDSLNKSGYDLIIGLELEFYVFDIEDPKLQLSQSGHPPEPPAVKAISHGYQYHAEDRIDQVEPIADQIRNLATALELPLRTIENEWGPGQFEVTFNPLNGLEAADSLLLFRSAVKQVMRRQGRLASFMAKPALPNVYSSGWHLHQSLRNIKTGSNAFASTKKKDLLSDTGKYYIGGLLQHAAAATVFSNPTVNGYKRLHGNVLAPNRILWSHDNRGAMLRLIGGYGNQATHIENRSGEPAANPYLYMASQIYAGLDGIQRKIEPGDPCQDNPYAQADKPMLPRTLMEAVDALSQSTVLRAGFGDQFIDYFLQFKHAEISRFLCHVTDWEHREYFEMY